MDHSLIITPLKTVSHIISEMHLTKFDVLKTLLELNTNANEI